MLEIDVAGLKALLDRGETVHLLDVREPEEVAICRLEGAEHIPMLQLFLGVAKPHPPAGALLVVYCHHGIRSLEAARFLRMRGFPEAISLAGGIDAWAAAVDPGLARY